MQIKLPLKSGVHTMTSYAGIMVLLQKVNDDNDYKDFYRTVCRAFDGKKLTPSEYLDTWFSLLTLDHLREIQLDFVLRNTYLYAKSLVLYHNPYFYTSIVTLIDSYKQNFNAPRVITKTTTPIVPTPKIDLPKLVIHDEIMSSIEKNTPVSTHDITLDNVKADDIRETQITMADIESASFNGLKHIASQNGIDTDGLKSKTQVKEKIITTLGL